MTTARLNLSRRQALGFAIGGAAGAASLSMLGLKLGSHGSLSSASGPSGAWASPLGDSRGQAAHLLRRATFGYTTAELDHAASMSYSDLVDSLVNQTPQAMPVPAKPTVYSSVGETWLTHMATTSAPFAERMTFFWHGHLTSDYRKAAGMPLVYQQNLLYRRYGLTDLRTLLVKATSDPLMMRYLDLDQSSASAPNENYSRELMELYTLGVGNFTESDVREGARALSGLRILIYDKNGNVIPTPRRQKGVNAIQQLYATYAQLLADGATWRGVLVPAQHDQGSKSYLGKTGNLGPTDVIDTILSRSECAPFVATKALIYFGVPTPSSDLVNRVASDFRNSKYDIKTLMRSIFTASEFTDPSNYRSLVRSPVDFMVASMRALGRSDFATQAFTAGPGMNQVLYDMPTVAGWPTNGAWLDSSSALARVNFAAALVASSKSLPSPTDAVTNLLDNVVGPDLANVFNASQSDSDRWYAILASAEFQLK